MAREPASDSFAFGKRETATGIIDTMSKIKPFAFLVAVLMLIGASGSAHARIVPADTLAGLPELPRGMPPAPWTDEPDSAVVLDASSNPPRHLQDQPAADSILALVNLEGEGSIYAVDPLGHIAASTMIATTTDERNNVLSREALFHPVDLRTVGTWTIIDQQRQPILSFTVLSDSRLPGNGLGVCGGIVDATDAESLARCLGDALFGTGAGEHCATNHYHVNTPTTTFEQPAPVSTGTTAGVIWKYKEQQSADVQGSCTPGTIYYDANAWSLGWDFYGKTSVGGGVNLYSLTLGQKGLKVISGSGTQTVWRYYKAEYPQMSVDKYNGLSVSLINQNSRDGASSTTDSDLQTALAPLVAWLLGNFGVPDYTNVIAGGTTTWVDYSYWNGLTGHDSTRMGWNHFDDVKSDGKGWSYGGKWSVQWNSPGSRTVYATGSTQKHANIIYGMQSNVHEYPGWINGYSQWTVNVAAT